MYGRACLTENHESHTYRSIGFAAGRRNNHENSLLLVVLLQLDERKVSKVVQKQGRGA
jgi:hypothetical protein